MKEKSDILFGFHSVYEALKADRRKFYKIFVSPQKRSLTRFEKIEVLAPKKNIKIEKAVPDFFDKMTNFANHQGILAKTSFFPVKNASEVTTLIKKQQKPCFILIMESIEDPHNLGALIRTALCAGVDYILIPKNRCATPSSTVSRSSAGAMEHANIFMITNTASILRSLKENGVWISGLDAKGNTSLFEADLNGNIALVIGGEHKGIRPGVKKECDFLLSIPNQGNINSLNASVAGGIAMYEAFRQRN
ncbi:MAG: 23S rRNA (guanosine(2251)-2'-O)-methyltransferase RlmB [Deltaproteobacteria bacterium]|jgi:23S rRNA (guanosine2251-2'-O)-methyltransferase|nr:23S rRNA (guanosine(2251)-2'-O)-methyltransferase RlmB [Deltaproteobacteria bacterium]